MNTCQFIKSNGEKCKTRPLKEDTYCFFHSESMKEKRKEAVTKGGNSIKRSYGRTDEITLSSFEDVSGLLEQTANDLRQNKINTKTASILNFVANTALKALEAKSKQPSPRRQKYNEELEKKIFSLSGFGIREKGE